MNNTTTSRTSEVATQVGISNKAAISLNTLSISPIELLITETVSHALDINAIAVDIIPVVSGLIEVNFSFAVVRLL